MTAYAELTTKKARIAHIKAMLASNQAWAIRGLLKIYSYQTADEQATETTREYNDVGFNGVDAEILSSFAKQVLAGRTMSLKQMALIYKKMPKYARQLELVASGAQQ